MKRLIVNADDFGRAHGVNSGILRAHRDGIVTATTLMANAACADEAGRFARETPSLDVGVHLVLTYGRPISDPERVRSLVDRDGHFRRAADLLDGESTPDGDEALAEFRAQHARTSVLIGREPTHLDSHHWVHDVPTLEWAIASLAAETRAAVRPHDDAQRGRLRAAGARTVDRYRRDFQHQGHIDVASLERILGEIREGLTELGCHPGESDADLVATSTYAADRAVELATLIDPRSRQAVARCGIALARYSDL